MTGGFHEQITFMNLQDRLVRCVDWARTGVSFFMVKVSVSLCVVCQWTLWMGCAEHQSVYQRRSL